MKKVRPLELARGRRSSFPALTCLALLVTAASALGVGANYAAAARPVTGALYGDTDLNDAGDTFAVLYLRVSTSGRWLNPRRSAIWWDPADSDSGSGLNCGVLRLHLGSRRRPVGIRRSGRFRFVDRRGGFVFRLRGRFVTKDRAKVKFRYRREPARRGRPGDCDDTGDRVVPRRIGPVSSPDCRTHKARTLLRAPSGRIFRQLGWWGGDFGWIKTAYGCLFSTNKPIKLDQDVDSLGPNEDDDNLLGFRLVGPYAAYILQPGGCALDCGEYVVVRDLRSGRRTRHLLREVVADLRLKGNGSVAWIERSRVGKPDSVWAADALGVRQLDSGKISARSLTLSGSTLTWTKDGMERSATLQ